MYPVQTVLYWYYIGAIDEQTMLSLLHDATE